MSDYIYANGELHSVDELKHYGVLGMKWGVRKGRTAAQYQSEYAKASKKLNKLNDKYTKREARTLDLQSKADKQISKMDSWATTGRGKRKAGKKLEKIMPELNKSKRKTYKAAVKGEKWCKAMEKNFAKVDIQMAKKDAEIGKKFAESIRLRALR